MRLFLQGAIELYDKSGEVKILPTAGSGYITAF